MRLANVYFSVALLNCHVFSIPYIVLQTTTQQFYCYRTPFFVADEWTSFISHHYPFVPRNKAGLHSKSREKRRIRPSWYKCGQVRIAPITKEGKADRALSYRWRSLDAQNKQTQSLGDIDTEEFIGMVLEVYRIVSPYLYHLC